MELKQAKRIVNARIREMRNALGLNNWHIDIVYKRIETESSGFVCQGRCVAKYQYKTAMIEIDNDQIDDEERLLHVLRHELLHCICAANRVFLEDVLDQVSSGYETTANRLHYYCEEQIIKHIETILDFGVSKGTSKTLGKK